MSRGISDMRNYRKGEDLTARTIIASIQEERIPHANCQQAEQGNADEAGKNSPASPELPIFAHSAFSHPVGELRAVVKPIASISWTLPSAPTLKMCAAGRSNGSNCISSSRS